jgi:uncharacterized lipoprotein NlpE involved in copper resistance
MKKKVFILFVLIFILSACTNRNDKTDNGDTISVPNPGNRIIGGERDSHGCLTPAGQHWCSSASKCLNSGELCK